MSLVLEAATSVLNFRFINKRYSVFFPFWEWKLNSFSCNYESGTHQTLQICFSEEKAVSLDDKSLIYTTEDRFLNDQIHILDEHRLVFTLINTEKKLIFLQYIFDIESQEVILTEDKTDTNGYAAVEYLIKIIPWLMIKANAFMLHGVLMEHEGRGIIISAPSGTGKSTHAHLWRDYKNAIILNGDISSCYQKEISGKKVWTGFGTPWCGTSGEYMNREVPITAIVVLERGDTNKATRIEGLEAFGPLLRELKLPVWDKALSEKGIDLLLKMLEDIPVIRLQCRPDTESVEVLDQALREL